MNEHDCLILCGGLGTRLKSVIGDTPKVMAEVGGRPFLDLMIGHSKKEGIARIILCTGHGAKEVEDYYREHDFGVTIDFSREETPLGTGGAVRNAREIVSSDTFFVLNGDSFLPVDLKALLDFHRNKKAVVSVVVAPAERSKDFGTVRMDASGRVLDFCEKIDGKEQPFVSAGVYCFDKAAFSLMPGQEKFSLETEFFPSLAGGDFYGYPTDRPFIDIGTPQRYESAKQSIGKGSNGGH